MRTFFHIIVCIIALTFWGCTDESLNIDYVRRDMRSINEAMQIAAQAYQNFYMENNRNMNLQASIRDVVIVNGRPSRGRGGDTLLYVVNFQDDEGFALVSAYKEQEELIGISNKGNYYPHMETESENFQTYIDIMTGYLQNNESASWAYPITGPVTPFFNGVEPQIKVYWGQNNPYGMFCPNSMSGCGPTAIAMIMSYYQFPDSIGITFDNSSYYTDDPNGKIALDWSNICKHVMTDSICRDDSLYTHTTIGILLSELGAITNSDYESYDNATWTSRESCIKCLKHFGYNCDSIGKLRAVNYIDGLRKKKVFFVHGLESENSGHYWLLDGYKTKYKTEGHTIYAINYCHFNWGWDGKCNGYFLPTDTVRSIVAEEFDYNTRKENHTFDRGVFLYSVGQ